jgi:hypothetical protein
MTGMARHKYAGQRDRKSGQILKAAVGEEIAILIVPSNKA